MTIARPPPSRIGLTNWLFGFTGLGISIALACTCIIGAQELKEELAFDMISDYIGGRLALDLKAHKAGYSDVSLEEADAAFEQLNESIESEPIKAISAAVLEFLRLDPAIAAQEKYFALTNQMEGMLISPELKTSDRMPAVARDRAKETIANFKKSQQALTSARDEQSSIDEEERRIFARFQLVADDFRDFLGFTGFKGERQAGEKTEPIFFKSGVLQDYPKIKNIPDGLIDLEALKSELDRLGLTPKVSGENSHEQFDTKMKDIKQASIATQDSYEAFLKRAEVIDNSALDSDTNYRKTLSHTREALSTFILKLLSPKVSEASLPVFEGF